MAEHRQPCGRCNAVLYPIGYLITSNDCEGDVVKANSVLPPWRFRLQCSDECPDCGYRYSHLYGPYEYQEPWSARRMDYVTVSLNVPLAALNELMIPRPPPTRYSLGVAGQFACPAGTSVVDSEADCKAVAASLGCTARYCYTSHVGSYCDTPDCLYTPDSTGHSPGCHFRNGSRQSVFFNPPEDFALPNTVVSSSGPICYWP